MIGLTADLNIVLMLIGQRFPKISSHFKKLGFELVMIFSEMFLTCFTTNLTPLTACILDMIFLESSTVYYKVILIILGYYQNEILQITDFGKWLLMIQDH